VRHAIFMDRGGGDAYGDTDTLPARPMPGTACLVNVMVHGEVAPLLQWLAVRPGWKLTEELRDGVRAEFAGGEPATLAAELRGSCRTASRWSIFTAAGTPARGGVVACFANRRC